MNLSVLKGQVNNIIVLLEELVEENGQEGDFESSVECQKDLDTFIKVKEELSELSNTDINPFYLTTIIKEHVPSLDLANFETYLLSLISRQTSKAQQMLREVEDYKNILSLISAKSE
jgi:hypothetical protein